MEALKTILTTIIIFVLMIALINTNERAKYWEAKYELEKIVNASLELSSALELEREKPTIEQLVQEQPLALRANLLTVLGAHASGRDGELLEILGPYAEASFKRLTGTNWIGGRPHLSPPHTKREYLAH